MMMAAAAADGRNQFACSGLNAEVMVKTADLMVSTGLTDAGFTYINMDDVRRLPSSPMPAALPPAHGHLLLLLLLLLPMNVQCWMLANRSEGGVGPQVPNPSKFPDGLPVVINHVHAQGLKFGLCTLLPGGTSPVTCMPATHNKTCWQTRLGANTLAQALPLPVSTKTLMQTNTQNGGWSEFYCVYHL